VEEHTFKEIEQDEVITQWEVLGMGTNEIALYE